MSDRIRTSLQALAIARSTEADEAVLVVYLHTLDDLSPVLVSRACERMAKLPREAYQAALPEVGLIRAEVAKIVREDSEAEHQRRLAPSPADADPRTWVFCPHCTDHGWRLFRCDGGTGDTGERDTELKRWHCGRRNGHFPHSYAERCGCVDTNPVIAKRNKRRIEAA